MTTCRCTHKPKKLKPFWYSPILQTILADGSQAKVKLTLSLDLRIVKGQALLFDTPFLTLQDSGNIETPETPNFVSPDIPNMHTIHTET